MKSEKENREWLNDYMSLKQVNPTSPFTVPDGYFDNLGSRIVALKNLDELKVNGKSGGFIVPENYFDELTGNIEARVKLEGFVSGEDYGFSVPEGYFENLGEQIQSRLFVEEALSANEVAFTLPEGYFENLEQQIQSRLFIEEALNSTTDAFAVPEGYFDKLEQQIKSRLFINEVLTANEDDGFEVPEGYFEGLTETIIAKTLVAKKTEQRGVIRKMFASTAVKYATAACLALVVGGGILLREISNNPAKEHQSSYLHKELLSVPVDDIKSYLQLNDDAGDTQQTVAVQGTQVDDIKLNDDLQNYLDSVQ